MGKIKDPMQIHWTNAVGGVVGYHAWGNHYYRAMAQHVANPDTLGQRNARTKLSFISRLIAAMIPAYKVGYATYAQGRSARAEFYHQIISEGAVTGNATDGYTVDYEKVFIAKGATPPTWAMTVSVIGAQHKVSLSWVDNSGQAGALATDGLCVMLYNATKKTSMFVEDGAVRSTEALQVQYPTSWAGDTVYTFVYWKAVSTKECSKSQMLNFFIAE